MEYYLPWMDCR